MSAQNELIQGSCFSSNELKKRLIKMQIPFNQFIKDKKYLIKKYNEAIKDENNLKFIIEELTSDYNNIKLNNLKRKLDKSNNQDIDNSFSQNLENENEKKILFNPINNNQQNTNLLQNSPLSSENKSKYSKQLKKKSTIRVDNLTEIKLLKEPSEFNLNFSSEKNINENGTDFKQYAQSSKITRVYNEGDIQKSIINLNPINIRDSIEYNFQKLNHNIIQINNQNNKNDYLRRRTLNNPLNIQYNIPQINDNIKNQRLSVPNNNLINIINKENCLLNNNKNLPKIKEYSFKKENEIYYIQNKFQNLQNNINNTQIDNLNIKFEEPKIARKSKSQPLNNFTKILISSPFDIKSHTEFDNSENNLQLNQTYQTIPNKQNKKKVQFCDEYCNKTFNNIIDIKTNQPQRKSNLIKHRNSVDNSNLYYNKTNKVMNEFTSIPNNNNLKDKNIIHNNFQIYESLINNSRKKNENLNCIKLNIDDNSTSNSSPNHSSNQNNNRIMKNIPSNLPLSPIKEINSQKKDNSSLNIENYNHNENNKDGYFNIIQNIKNGLKSKEINNDNYIINNSDNNKISFGNDSDENNNSSIPLKQSIIFDKTNNNNLYKDIEKEGLSPINKNYNNTTYNYDNYNFNKDFIQTNNQLNKTEAIYDEIDTSSNKNNLNLINDIYDMKNNINSQNEKEFKWGKLMSNNNNDDNQYFNNLNFQNQNDYNSKFNYSKKINPRYNEPQTIQNNGQLRLLLNKEEKNINYDLIYSFLVGGFSVGALSLCYYYCLKNQIFFNRNDEMFSNNELNFNNFIKMLFSPFETFYIIITNPRKYIFESLILLLKNIGKFLFWDFLKFTIGIFISSSIGYTLYKKYKENCLIEKIFNEIKNDLKRLYDNAKLNKEVDNYFDIGISENEIIKKYHHEFNLSQEQFLKRILPKLRVKRKNDYNIKNFENIINGRKLLIWQWNPY